MPPNAPPASGRPDTLCLLQAPNGWTAARLVLYIQNGRWYVNERIGKTADDYHADLVHFLDVQKDFCERVGVDCFIATISCVDEANPLWSWSDCDRDQAVRDVNAITANLLDATTYPQNGAFHFVDVASLLSAMPNEYAGHNGPVLGLWTVCFPFPSAHLPPPTSSPNATNMNRILVQWFAIFNALPEAGPRVFDVGPTASVETTQFTEAQLVESALPPCLRTAPHLPPWT